MIHRTLEQVMLHVLAVLGLAAAAFAPAAGALADAPLCPDLGQNQVGACYDLRACCEGAELRGTIAVGDAGGARVHTDTAASLRGAASQCASAGLTQENVWVTALAGFDVGEGPALGLDTGQAGC